MLTEMPMREKERTVASSPDRISVIDVSDKPRTGLIGRLIQGGKYRVTVNFMCGKHFVAEFPYKGANKTAAKHQAYSYLADLYVWDQEQR